MKKLCTYVTASLALSLVAGLGANHSVSAAASGSVTCFYGNGAENGAWVDAGSRSGWATLRSNGNDGKFYSYANLPSGTRYRLHVGCGGTPANWGAKFYTPYTTSGSSDWVCTSGYNCIES